MPWGAGPALGLLAFIGYVLLVMGALRVWRNRGDISVWVQDETSIFRSTFSRYTPVGPFYSLREESRLRAIPNSFIGSLSRLPRCRAYRGAALLAIGLLLFLLDFLV
jgi:hypothetical protein